MHIELLQTIKPQIVQSADCIQAMLLAALPLVNQFLESAHADLTPPVTTNEVRSVGCRYDRLGPMVSFTLTNGWSFSCQGGIVAGFESPHTFTAIEDFSRLEEYFGRLNLSKSDAIDRARKSLRAMGFSNEELFFDSEPSEFEGPRHEGRNVVPYYMMTWSDPRGNPTVSAELSGTTGELHYLSVLAQSAYRSGWLDGQLSDACKPEDGGNQEQLNPEFLAEYVPTIIREGSKFLHMIGKLPDQKLDTNGIASISIAVRGSLPIARVTLTNGLQFALAGGAVYQFKGTNALWRPPPEPIGLKGLIGAWKLTEMQALTKARMSVKLAGFDPKELGVNRRPTSVAKPRTAGAAYEIPRFLFQWQIISRKGLLAAITSVEINAESGELEGLTVQDFLRPTKPMGIDVPIILEAAH